MFYNIFVFVDNIWPTSQPKYSDLFAPEAVSPVAAQPPPTLGPD